MHPISFQGLSIALSTLALSAANYITDPCCDEKQPSSVDHVLRLISGVAAPGLVLISGICCYFYPLTTAEMCKIKAALLSRHQSDDSGANKSGVTETFGSQLFEDESTHEPLLMGNDITESEA
eukprot:m.110103 g.110103  ORF g.110103 m.110103 type:complete len:123 (+) comp22705_c0_seq2:1339-1707(+)